MAEPDRNERKSQFFRYFFEGLAALAALATIIALLFGDHLLDQNGDRARRETQSLTPEPAPSVPANGSQQSAVGLDNSNESTSPSQDVSAVIAALDKIGADEWCSISATMLLKRVLKVVERSELEKSADTGDARAQLLVGRAYIDGLFGFPKEPTMAFSFFKRAASSEFPAALNALAVAYEDGVGTDPDSYAAVRLYKRASNAGCVYATANLAQAYRAGLGPLPADNAEAIRLFSLAAKEGHEASRQALVRYESQEK